MDARNEGADADDEDEEANEEGGEVFDTAVAVGVLAVGLFLGEFDADEDDERGEDVREVVGSVNEDGGGARKGADESFDDDEGEVEQNAKEAGADDFLIAVGHKIIITRKAISFSRNMVK